MTLTKDTARRILLPLTPVTVEDGGLFEAAVLSAELGHYGRRVLFQGSKPIAKAVALAINSFMKPEKESK